MKKIILFTFITFIFNWGCKKDKKFEMVSREVYTINKITKGGCFDYDPADTTALLPITVGETSMNIENGFVIVKFSTDYFCLANDSIDLKGNVLSIFLKLNDNKNTDCNCAYSWKIKLNIIENTGMKLLYFEYENGNYVQKQEMYSDVLY